MLANTINQIKKNFNQLKVSPESYKAQSYVYIIIKEHACIKEQFLSNLGNDMGW